jgi:hypothetical protein
MTVTVVELIGVALGTLVCGLPYLFYGATSPPIAITSVALAAAAAGLALLRPGARWQTGAGVGVGLLIVIVVRIIVDYNRDPKSHNLAPFEILSALVIGFPPAILGVLLGNLVRRRVPWPEVGGIAFVTLAVGVAAVSAMATASDIIRVETLALKKVVALIAAQREFRAAHPLRGYTCDLGELGEPFSGAITSHPPSESYRLDGVVYRGGTAAFAGEYRYSLKCEGKTDPQELFVLTARAQPVGSRPLHIFCAGPDGAIRSIRSGRLYSCFAQGRIVRNVN